MSSVWTFKQLEGDELTLRLEAHAAPHGAPRRGAVVEPAIQIRNDEAYLGTNAETPPVRQIFGPKFPPIKLTGRFSDGYGGKDFAKNKSLEVSRFVLPAWRVAIVWDDLFAGTGLIEEYIPKIERDGEIEWEMSIRRDSDDILARDANPQAPLRQPVDFANQIILASTVLPKIPKTPPTLNGSIFDLLDQLVSDVNQFTSALVSLASGIADMEKASFAELRRFRLGLQQVGTAVVTLRETYDQLKIDEAMESSEANDAVAFWDVQTEWSVSSLTILQSVADGQRAAAIAEAGRTLAYYTARDGDTWESISSQYFKSPDRADDIRAANGIEAGQAPLVGATYRIPS